jgi:hypothetical protein
VSSVVGAVVAAHALGALTRMFIPRAVYVRRVRATYYRYFASKRESHDPRERIAAMS